MLMSRYFAEVHRLFHPDCDGVRVEGFHDS